MTICFRIKFRCPRRNIQSRPTNDQTKGPLLPELVGALELQGPKYPSLVISYHGASFAWPLFGKFSIVNNGDH